MQSGYSGDTSKPPPTSAGPALPVRGQLHSHRDHVWTIAEPLERAAEALEIFPFTAVRCQPARGREHYGSACLPAAGWLLGNENSNSLTPLVTSTCCENDFSCPGPRFSS